MTSPPAEQNMSKASDKPSIDPILPTYINSTPTQPHKYQYSDFHSSLHELHLLSCCLSLCAGITLDRFKTWESAPLDHRILLVGSVICTIAFPFRLYDCIRKYVYYERKSDLRESFWLTMQVSCSGAGIALAGFTMYAFVRSPGGLNELDVIVAFIAGGLGALLLLYCAYAWVRCRSLEKLDSLLSGEKETKT